MVIRDLLLRPVAELPLPLGASRSYSPSFIIALPIAVDVSIFCDVTIKLTSFMAISSREHIAFRMFLCRRSILYVMIAEDPAVVREVYAVMDAEFEKDIIKWSSILHRRYSNHDS